MSPESTSRVGTACRAAALAALAGVLGIASLQRAPDTARPGRVPTIKASHTANDDPIADTVDRAADEVATITDEVLDWAESALTRMRGFVGEPAAEARQVVAATTGLRLLEAGDAGEANDSGADAGDGGALDWRPIDASMRTPDRLVVLVHGLDEPGDIWDELAPAIRAQGLRVARFDYPNDQSVADSTDQLANTLKDLCITGTHRVDLVCHSMGGLVARDLLTRAEYYNCDTVRALDLPSVERVITVGTPYFGAPLAPLRGLAEVRDQLARLVDDDDITLGDLLRFSSDGNGEAGIDLAPGSAFLNNLNARPFPHGARWTVIAGQVASDDEIRALGESKLSRALGLDDDLDELLGLLVPISEDLGDGAVPSSSALLPGVEDTVVLVANHRSLLRTMSVENAIRGALGHEPQPVPPAIPVIVDRLLEPVVAVEPSDAGD